MKKTYDDDAWEDHDPGFAYQTDEPVRRKPLRHKERLDVKRRLKRRDWMTEDEEE